MKQILFIFLVVVSLFAQGVSEVTFFTPMPPDLPSSQITAQVIGLGGQRTLYYWMVTTYLIGNSITTGPVTVFRCPNTMSGSNYVQLNWPAMTGAVSYDVLRTTVPSLPSGPGIIARATGVAATTFADTTDILVPYTISVAPNANGYLRLNNKDYATPRYEISPPLLQALTITNFATINFTAVNLIATNLAATNATIGTLTLLGPVVLPGGYLVFPAGSEPPCTALVRGAIAFVAGGAGVADTFRICTKDANNTYAYRALY